MQTRPALHRQADLQVGLGDAQEGAPLNPMTRVGAIAVGETDFDVMRACKPVEENLAHDERDRES